MNGEYRIDDELIELRLEGSGRERTAHLTTTVDGGEATTTTVHVRVQAIDAESCALEIGGRRLVAFLNPQADDTEVCIRGYRHRVTSPAVLERQRRSRGGVDPQQHVTPPMPGQVCKVLVTEGEQVEAGQAVIVISAMKMETTLSAPFAGTVKAIRAKVDDQVKPGDLLVDIEPADPVD